MDLWRLEHFLLWYSLQMNPWENHWSNKAVKVKIIDGSNYGKCSSKERKNENL